MFHRTPFIDSFDERLWAMDSICNEELELPFLIIDAHIRQYRLLQPGQSINLVVLTKFQDSKQSWNVARLHTEYMVAKAQHQYTVPS